jgi:YD repeat-containing protein
MAMVNDAWGRTLTLMDPDIGTTTTEYNAFGEVVRRVDANGQDTRFRFDGLGRLTRRTDIAAGAGGADAITQWTWDGGGNPDRDAGELYGRLTRTRSPDGVDRHLRYDADSGLLISTLLEVAGDSFETVLERDEFGRVEAVHYPAVTGVPAVTVHNVFDDFDRLVSVENPSSPGSAPYWTLDETDDHGLLQRETYGNGLLGSHAYDDFGRPTLTQTAGCRAFSWTCL